MKTPEERAQAILDLHWPCEPREAGPDIKLLIAQAIREAVADAMPRWIPVSERLPEPGEACLLSLENYWVGVATYNRARNQWRSDGGYIVQATNNATHWMPLPLPPNWPH